MSSATRIKNARKVRRRKFAATAQDAARSLSLLVEDLQEEAICARIQQARKEAGLNQDEFADLLEVIKRTVQYYESDRVPWSRMGQIAEITGKSTRWLLHGEDLPDQSDIGEMRREVDDIAAKLEELLRRTPAADPELERAEAEAEEEERADQSERSDDAPGEETPGQQHSGQ